ncbi:MAG: helix-turn-helix transcriptional regulator [Rhodoglobus sp.]
MTDSELARLLRTWRDRATPADAGLPAGGTRRAAGLRREELAGLAGLSVDYVVRLEQGRSTHPSAQVVGSLARALRLSMDETDHLYRVAGMLPPTSGTVPTHIPPGVHRLLDRLADTPVSVHSASWTMLTWNPLWAALLGDPTARTGRGWNIAWNHFSGGETRVVREATETAAFERSMVADLREASGRYPRDTELAGMVADLQRTSARFAELWAAGEVASHESARKTIDHPLVGRVTFDCDVLSAASSDLRIVAYTAEPGSVDAEKLDLLRVTGIQVF